MRTVDIKKATGSLADYAKGVRKDPVVVTRKGRPLAALMPLKNTDEETATLSTHPGFVALIERARVRHEKEGGMTSVELRKQVAVKSRPSTRSRKRR